MKARDIIIGLAVLVILITGALLIRRARNSKNLTAVPTSNIAQNVESKFPGLVVPENADRANLGDVSGGQGMGEAIRTFENGKFSLTIIADLPEPKAGEFYRGFLVSGDKQILLGTLSTAKGGFLLDFTSTQDLTSYNKVVVTLGQARVLEGSF